MSNLLISIVIVAALLSAWYNNSEVNNERTGSDIDHK